MTRNIYKRKQVIRVEVQELKKEIHVFLQCADDTYGV